MAPFLLLCFGFVLFAFNLFFTLVSTTSTGLTSAASPALPFPPLIDVTLEDLVTGLESNAFTSVDLVKAYTDRINEVNSTLHVVEELNPDAFAIAAALDDERGSGTVRGPLHGVPILIKANIATADKMTTTAGSFALYGATVPRDSGVAAKLRSAGAIILGKTNLSQWANFRSLNTSNGWSAYGGQTFGAYYPQQDPSGSSSGSGVAASIGLALAALGTETSGSIISPSSTNNLVGIKPTVGLTSRSLVVPISQRQDTVGPMSRSVKDAAYLLQAIAGPDPNDNYTSAIPFTSIPNYISACDFSAFRGKRIGVPRNYIQSQKSPSQAPILAAFERALAIVRSAGAVIIDPANLPNSTIAALKMVDNTSTTILEADFLTNIKTEYLDMLTSNPNNVTDLQAVRTFTQSFPQEEYPSRDTGLWDQSIAQNITNMSPQFWAIENENIALAGSFGFLGLLSNLSLDALMLPSDFSSSLPAIVGTPIMTVPLGFYPPNTTVMSTSRGLVETGPNVPYGLSFVGEAFSEEALIGFAYAFEQRSKVRNMVQPYIVPNTELASVLEA